MKNDEFVIQANSPHLTGCSFSLTTRKWTVRVGLIAISDACDNAAAAWENARQRHERALAAVGSRQ